MFNTQEWINMMGFVEKVAVRRMFKGHLTRCMSAGSAIKVSVGYLALKIQILIIYFYCLNNYTKIILIAIALFRKIC